MIPYRSTFFFFNDTATTEIYTLSLHDALPISADDGPHHAGRHRGRGARSPARPAADDRGADRKITRLNSSHSQISYAVFCLKKKKNNTTLHVADPEQKPTARIRSTTRDTSDEC